MSEKTRKGSSKKKARQKTVFEFSAGGVVARAGEILLVWARDLKGRSVITLPKGLVNRGETSEEAALRETREETGYRCNIVKELPKSEYFYRRGDKLVRKTVRWFLMEPVEKEGEHDHEIDDVRWLPVKEAIDALSYDSDRKLVETVEAGL
jgi:8-oxo-dGTP pyrophosphatase MutT (NUDIX family)